MKRMILLSAMMSMFFMACTEKPDEPTPTPTPTPTPEEAEIRIDATSVVIPVDGGTESVKFNSTQKWNADVKYNEGSAWCIISPKSGAAGDAVITIEADENTDGTNRTATLTIASGKVKKTVSISQKQKDALTVTASRFEVSADGGDVEITVKANIEFEYEISADWITFAQTRAMTTHELIFHVSPNDVTEPREGKITFTSGDIKEEVTIAQAGKEVSYEEVYAKEKAILTTLFEATGGSGWTDNTNWCSDLPVSQWYGIMTDHDGFVIDISLQSNNLTGSIPEGLSGLERLISLEELRRDHSGIPHGGFVIRTGTTGENGQTRQKIEYSLELGSNPEFTASVIVAYARAAVRMNREGVSGAKTVLDVPPAYISPKSCDELRRTLL